MGGSRGRHRNLLFFHEFYQHIEIFISLTDIGCVGIARGFALSSEPKNGVQQRWTPYFFSRSKQLYLMPRDGTSATENS